MSVKDTGALYKPQSSISSVGSNDSEISSSSSEMIRQKLVISDGQKAVPTLATGRRSKHLVLVGDEAIRREKRRERNRQAARKLKEKRQIIEEELNQKLQELENQHSTLEKYLRFLEQRKRLLENTINDLRIDPIDELLSTENHDMTLFFEQYSSDFDFSDEPIGDILNTVI